MGEMATELERGAHLVAAYLDATLAELHLTQGEAHVLAQVARRGTMSIATLHHEFGHKRSTLTNIIDRLEKRKLVRRQLDRSDRRSFLVQLTASGIATARRVTRALDQLDHELAVRIEKNDPAALQHVVNALQAIVRRPRRRPG